MPRGVYDRSKMKSKKTPKTETKADSAVETPKRKYTRKASIASFTPNEDQAKKSNLSIETIRESIATLGNLSQATDDAFVKQEISPVLAKLVKAYGEKLFPPAMVEPVIEKKAETKAEKAEKNGIASAPVAAAPVAAAPVAFNPPTFQTQS